MCLCFNTNCNCLNVKLVALCILWLHVFRCAMQYFPCQRLGFRPFKSVRYQWGKNRLAPSFPQGDHILLLVLLLQKATLAFHCWPIGIAGKNTRQVFFYLVVFLFFFQKKSIFCSMIAKKTFIFLFAITRGEKCRIVLSGGFLGGGYQNKGERKKDLALSGIKIVFEEGKNIYTLSQQHFDKAVLEEEEGRRQAEVAWGGISQLIARQSLLG